MSESILLASSRAPDSSAISRARAGDTALADSVPTRNRVPGRHDPLERLTAAPGRLDEIVDERGQPSRRGQDGVDLGAEQQVVRVDRCRLFTEYGEVVAGAIRQRLVLVGEVPQADQRGHRRDDVLCPGTGPPAP